jgi:hypothetical protein
MKGRNAVHLSAGHICQPPLVSNQNSCGVPGSQYPELLSTVKLYIFQSFFFRKQMNNFVNLNIGAEQKFRL